MRMKSRVLASISFLSKARKSAKKESSKHSFHINDGHDAMANGHWPSLSILLLFFVCIPFKFQDSHDAMATPVVSTARICLYSF